MAVERSIIPWSWSTLDAYKTCPRQFYEMKVAKNFTQPDTLELMWGKEVHTGMQKRVQDGVPLPPRMVAYEPLAAKLVAREGTKHCELETAVDINLNACGFWDKDAWNRGYEDIVITHENKALTVDYKTGKFKPRSRQLDLSALRIFAKFPEIDIVHSAFAYLQTNQWVRDTFHRADYYKLWETFYADIKDMIWSQENNAWPMKPSGLCKKSRRPGSTYAGCPVATCPHSEFYRK